MIWVSAACACLTGFSFAFVVFLYLDAWRAAREMSDPGDRTGS